MSRLTLLLLWSTLTLVFSSTTLLKNWRLQTSEKLQGVPGDEISIPSYDDRDWLPITVPATVMAGLLQNNMYPDIYYGLNMKEVDVEQFDVTWWYRTEFTLTQEQLQQRVRVLFEGINYRASVWLNGKNIRTAADMVGTFIYFDLEVTTDVLPTNVLAVEITRPINSNVDKSTTDLAISFVDWSPPPADSNMGLWRDVKLIITGGLTINYPMVNTSLETLQLAHLTIMAEVANLEDRQVTALVTATIEGIEKLYQSVHLQPKQVLDVYFRSSAYPLLNIQNPSLWWPWQMGEANLYQLTMTIMEFSSDIPSDFLSVNFGIREATSELTDDGYRLYRINGKPILIRGAGWSPDLFLRYSKDWHEIHFKYMKDMYLNTVRLEGKMEDDEFIGLANTMGMLVMPGWCCCDSWEHWAAWKEEQFEIAEQSTISQLKRLRIHPSVFVFVYSSDDIPPPNVERVYLQVFLDHAWPNPILAAASDRQSTLSGPTGVKMSGPYSWEPPNYWLLDTDRVGGAYGFLTEGGPGQNPLSMESFDITIPNDERWPINEYWDYHCGADTGQFGNLGTFTPAVNERYGTADSAEDYLEKSQLNVYESHKAMFEGYGRNKYTSTGVIQWMLNNPFPSMIWHLYDYYFNPSSAYFATKRACEPLHIQYSYDDNSIWVVNSLYVPSAPVIATIEVYDIDATLLYQRLAPITRIDADTSLPLFQLPNINPLSTSYFVRLYLTNSTARFSHNFYWLSTVKDVLDWDQSTWWETPTVAYSDHTLLQTLPHINLEVSSSTTYDPTTRETTTEVTIENPEQAIALFIHARVLNASGQDVWPIFWDDNYITLVQGETRILTAKYLSDGVEGIHVQTELWNNISGGKNLKSFLNR